MVDADILAYYSRGLERDRLASGARRIEFLRIWDLLERFLPPAPARVLDVGGGAGAYAIPLAAAGYQVHLIDPVPLHVEQAAAASAAAAAPLAGVCLGDARELAAADGGADAVLLLGPLYHLTDRADRVTALREARRVLRPGGIVVAKALSRFYPVFESLAKGLSAEFTTAYFHRPEELPCEVADAGLELRAFVAGSGIVKLLPGVPELLESADGRDRVLGALRLLEAEPSLIGMSQNFIAIAEVSK
jgi:SAM-dependent methyltransferase